MDNFKIIYKILKYLENCMGQAEIDTTPLTAEALHVEQGKLDEILGMMLKNGYIEGAEAKYYVNSRTPVILNLNRAKITLKGLEYLEENSMMKKVANHALGLAEDIIKQNIQF